jgi:hypothetical protein
MARKSYATEAAVTRALTDSSRIFGRHDLTWHGNVLKLGSRKVAEIVPETTWSGMWRIKVGDRISDMVNRARACDAARALALGALNGKRTQETPSEAPYKRKNGAGVLGS